MHTETPTLTEAPCDTWIEPSPGRPGLEVERSPEYDAYAALVERAALAAWDAISSPGSMDSWSAVTAAIDGALFPAVPPASLDDPFRVVEHVPILMGHGPVSARYSEDRITIRANRNVPLHTPGWWFSVEARNALEAPEIAQRFLRIAGLDQIRTGVLESAHRLSGFVKSSVRHMNTVEIEAIKTWGLLPQSNPRSWVYFIRRGATGTIKIGWSRSPVSRMAQLQTGQEVPLHLLAMAPGSSTDEANLHRRFGAFRLTGEWFSASPVLEAYVRAVRSAGVL